jgi:hypothetical protein
MTVLDHAGRRVTTWAEKKTDQCIRRGGKVRAMSTCHGPWLVEHQLRRFPKLAADEVQGPAPRLRRGSVRKAQPYGLADISLVSRPVEVGLFSFRTVSRLAVAERHDVLDALLVTRQPKASEIGLRVLACRTRPLINTLRKCKASSMSVFAYPFFTRTRFV